MTNYDILRLKFNQYKWGNEQINDKILLGAFLYDLIGERGNIYDVKMRKDNKNNPYVDIKSNNIVYPELNIIKKIPDCLISEVRTKWIQNYEYLLDKEYYLKQIFRQITLKVFGKALDLI